MLDAARRARDVSDRSEGPLSDLENRRDEILADVDQFADDVVNLLSRAAMFVVAQAGWGFAYDFRRRVFNAILQQSADLVSRWNDKETEFNALIAEEAALPGTATDEERFVLLRRAESAISAIPTTPLPAATATLRDDLVKREAAGVHREAKPV